MRGRREAAIKLLFCARIEICLLSFWAFFIQRGTSISSALLLPEKIPQSGLEIPVVFNLSVASRHLSLKAAAAVKKKKDNN